jgi:cytidine deaminase
VDIAAKSMKKEVELHEYLFSDLSSEDQQFLKQAQRASEKSYAPYSQFYVGCSVAREDGSFVDGSNQENASFPSGLCAERVALFECSKDLETNKVTKLAVYAHSDKYEVPNPLVPCAACLQVISDIRSRQKTPIEIWMWDGNDSVYKSDDVGAFLPFHFDLVRKN